MNIDLLGLQEPFNNLNIVTPLQIKINYLRKQLAPNFEILSQNLKKKVNQLLMIFINLKDLKEIQNYSRLGLLQELPLLRAHIWKLLLQSIPLDHQKWQEKKQFNYELYLKLLEGQSHNDQPQLLQLNESRFDQQLWNQIMNDSKRTYAMMNFFQSQINQIKIYNTKVTRHYDVLTRILYIWAKTNAGVRYVQGMNEILAPLYYLQFQSIKKQSESEVFFMFSALMNSILDLYIKDMDKTQFGIWGRMRYLNNYLKTVDYELWKKLESEGIKTQFYAFKWLSLLLSQQFGLYETLKIWDILFSYEGERRFKFLYSICVVIIRMRKQFIMKEQFTNILPKLQNLKDLDIQEILQVSFKLYEKLAKVDINKLLARQEQIRNQKKKQQIKKSQTFYKKTESIIKKFVNIQKK